MTWLLDGNVLAAIALEGHPHHPRAMAWFDSLTDSFATCPVTQGTLLRLHMQFAANRSAAAAWRALSHFTKLPEHQFWGDGISYDELSPMLIQGHRQVTDAWLVALAERHGGKLMTLDAALVALYPQYAALVPVL